MTSTSPRTISVVINTLNRAAHLETTLEALLYQDYPHFEVVVVNGPSTDGTADLLAAWAHQVKIGSCPEANLSMSRNIGIAMAAGDIVVFIDDDGVPEPEWLTQVASGFDDPRVGAAGGLVLDHTGHKVHLMYCNADRLGNGHWGLPSASPEMSFPHSFEFPYLYGTNAAFRRSALLEIGGFDEAFVYYLDETDVCLRVMDRGYLVHQMDQAFVHHKYAPSHLRKPGAHTYRYPILRSKVYFSNRHAPEYATQQEIDADNLALMDGHRGDVVAKIASGLLTEQDLVQFEAHVTQALTEGKKLAQSGPYLMTAELMKEHASPFKRFEVNPQNNKMTIVFLCEDYPPNLLGGVARFTQDKATALAQQGHKVHVIALGSSHDTVDFEKGVWVHRIVSRNHALPEDSQVAVPQHLWNQSASYLDELDRIATKQQIDIVEAPVWNLVGIACLLSGRYRLLTSLQTTLKISLPNRPDLTSGDPDVARFVDSVVASERLLLTDSEGIVAISHAIADEVERSYELLIDPARLYVAPLGMPDWNVGDAPPLQVPSEDDALTLLFVGRLENRKGVDLLLEIAPSLLSLHPNTTLHLAGDDSIPHAGGSTYREEFERAHPDLAQRVIFHGRVDESELRRLYATCDVFVAPSRFESFGLIYLEAMMFSKAVVGTTAGGIPEVVDHGASGVLVAPGSAEELRDGLDRLLSDAGLRTELGKHGRARYENQFTAAHMADAAMRAYRTATGAGAPN